MKRISPFRLPLARPEAHHLAKVIPIRSSPVLQLGQGLHVDHLANQGLLFILAFVDLALRELFIAEGVIAKKVFVQPLLIFI